MPFYSSCKYGHMSNKQTLTENKSLNLAYELNRLKSATETRQSCNVSYNRWHMQEQALVK